MHNSWEHYYAQHSGDFDESHRMSIYVRAGNEDVLFDLGYKYLEDEEDLGIEMPVGKWSPSVTEDESGNEIECLEIQHKVATGWEAEDSWWNKEEEQEEYVKRHFGISKKVLVSIGIWNCE